MYISSAFELSRDIKNLSYFIYVVIESPLTILYYLEVEKYPLKNRSRSSKFASSRLKVFKSCLTKKSNGSITQ